MSMGDLTGGAPGACARCARRSWLLSELCGPLECCARDRGRLIELLALADGELLQALAGRRRAELAGVYERFRADELARAAGVESICRHRRAYPRTLDGPAAPHMLEVAGGGAARLARLTRAPVVAVLGSRAASDYGIAIARSLARGLAASGVTVAASLTDGIAVAAHAGALDAGAGSVAVMGGGLGVACPARRRSLYERVTRGGCAISELPSACAGRRWGQLASERILVELARVTVVVEADDTREDLAAAQLARALGRCVAAVPGRVSSPRSRGSHALLMSGARLVRGPHDVLELLYALDGPPAREGSRSERDCAAPAGGYSISPPGAPDEAGGALGGLQPRLRATLERVGDGCDTPEKLTRAGADAYEVLLALSELELLGLLVRGDGGRYVPAAGCQPRWRPDECGPSES